MKNNGNFNFFIPHLHFSRGKSSYSTFQLITKRKNLFWNLIKLFSGKLKIQLLYLSSKTWIKLHCCSMLLQVLRSLKINKKQKSTQTNHYIPIRRRMMSIYNYPSQRINSSAHQHETFPPTHFKIKNWSSQIHK